MFRRRRGADEGDDFDDAEQDDLARDDADDPGDVAERPPTSGPWDVTDLPKGDDTTRVDLGGLHVPIVDGVELRVEVADGVVVAAALVDGASQLVVNAFAAPKSAGIWDDVRTEIADSLKSGGGSAEHAEGSFGTELRARIPDETGGHQQARFVGVDGPRWFLRGLMTGPAATDVVQAGRLEQVFRGIAVARGTDAMAPRDPVPLHLPREMLDAAEQAAEEAAEEDEAPRLELRERGPEISEIR